MKTTSSIIILFSIIAVYYAIWAITLPFAMIKLFISVATDVNDGENNVTMQGHLR